MEALSMSGPITVTMLSDPVTVLLLATGIRAANRIAQAHADAARMHEAQQTEQKEIKQRLTELDGQRDQAFEHAVQEAEARYAQLLALAQQLGLGEQAAAGRPVLPEAGNAAANAGINAAANSAARAAWLDALQAFNTVLQRVLNYEMARRASDSSLPEPALEALAELAGAGALAPGEPAAGADAAAQSETKQLARRLLARLEALGPVPAEIAQVAQVLAQTAPGERAELLATDLRLRIARHVAQLEAVLVQQATALVVEQSLKDLGYQVEPIGETLFVEGGTVHFRKPGWGDYLVRMRISPASGQQAASANFNVIRKVQQAQNEVSVLDHLAEDRWCAEFPALQAMLAARGVQMNVTRRLAAGELPVQCVHESKLPTLADAEAHAGEAGQYVGREAALRTINPNSGAS
jgi:hypothetical protein